jgi:hypothetical protein
MLAPNPDPTIASVFAPPTRIEPDGTVEGYASLFGEIDQARDMMLRGAFADTLTRRGVRRIPMLFQHTRPSRSAFGSTCTRIRAGFTRVGA